MYSHLLVSEFNFIVILLLLSYSVNWYQRSYVPIAQLSRLPSPFLHHFPPLTEKKKKEKKNPSCHHHQSTPPPNSPSLTIEHQLSPSANSLMKPSGEAIQTREPPLARSPNPTTFTVEWHCHQTPLKAPIQSQPLSSPNISHQWYRKNFKLNFYYSRMNPPKRYRV